MKTTYPRGQEIPRAWHLVDADDQVLGRVAARVARVLMGKHRPIYAPHMDTGEFVVIVNADKVKLTGKKRDTRVVRHHTGWMGGLKEVPLARMMDARPEDVICHRHVSSAAARRNAASSRAPWATRRRTACASPPLCSRRHGAAA